MDRGHGSCSGPGTRERKGARGRASSASSRSRRGGRRRLRSRPRGRGRSRSRRSRDPARSRSLSGARRRIASSGCTGRHSCTAGHCHRRASRRTGRRCRSSPMWRSRQSPCRDRAGRRSSTLGTRPRAHRYRRRADRARAGFPGTCSPPAGLLRRAGGASRSGVPRSGAHCSPRPDCESGTTTTNDGRSARSSRRRARRCRAAAHPRCRRETCRRRSPARRAPAFAQASARSRAHAQRLARARGRPGTSPGGSRRRRRRRGRRRAARPPRSRRWSSTDVSPVRASRSTR